MFHLPQSTRGRCPRCAWRTKLAKCQAMAVMTVTTATKGSKAQRWTVSRLGDTSLVFRKVVCSSCIAKQGRMKLHIYQLVWLLTGPIMASFVAHVGMRCNALIGTFLFFAGPALFLEPLLPPTYSTTSLISVIDESNYRFFLLSLESAGSFKASLRGSIISAGRLFSPAVGAGIAASLAASDCCCKRACMKSGNSLGGA